MTGEKRHLLIIDPQNDFCDLPAEYCPTLKEGMLLPALPVPGAHQDMLRMAKFIDQAGRWIDEITITLDSHQRVDIAHPAFWRQGDLPVAPFTQIYASDVRAGKYLPRDTNGFERVLSYLDVLENEGRYVHMVWPVHCEIGTWGHNVHIDVRFSYNAWEEKFIKNVGKISKGFNPWTEHYSAIRAEVPDPEDETTQLNKHFIAKLKQADQIFIAGEASSHCVKATTEHILENMFPEEIRKLVLLIDCMSPVAGFEKQHQSFIESMQLRGVRIARSDEILKESGVEGLS